MQLNSLSSNQSRLQKQVSLLPNQTKLTILIFPPLNRDSDFAKSAYEVFKALEKKHPKRVSGVTSTNTKLIEEALLPMLTAQDV